MEINEKVINIIGTNNKYQIKKLTKDKEIKKRKISEKYDITNINIKDEQRVIIKNIYENNGDVNRENEPIKVLIEKEINKKIYSYKNQDIIKKKFNLDCFIDYKNIIKMLYNCDLKCYYCKEDVLILYDLVREMKQWSLDRIDNEKGHNIDNVLISCLECNLKRKNIRKDAFLFTKELNIIKGP